MAVDGCTGDWGHTIAAMGGDRRGSGIRSYRDLIAWQKAMALVVHAYRQTTRLPSEERFELSGQIRRCVVRIPSCIAEGWARRSTRDYVRFLRIAQGSAYELMTQSEISEQLGFDGDWRGLRIQTDEVARILNGLISSLLPAG